MLIKFDKDLTKQEIYAEGIELAQIMGKDRDENGNVVYSWPESEKELVHMFRNPVLMTDSYRIGRLNPLTRDRLFELFRRYTYTTEYDKTHLDFDQKKYEKLWGPNIDTLFFCKTLENKYQKIFRDKNIIEIGAGSGFISKYILSNHEIKSITLIDINPGALQCWKDNISDKRAIFRVGDAIKYLGAGLNRKGYDRKFDVIICNPPYIPRISSKEDNAYEGVGLLEYLIRNTSKFLNPGGIIITNVSSVSQKYFENVCRESEVDMKLLDSMNVPLKVLNVIGNKEWVNYLIKKGLNKQYRQGYDYWHKIQMYEMRPRP